MKKAGIPPKPNPKKNPRSGAQYLMAGTNMAVLIVGGLLVGYYLQKKGIVGPWGTAAGVLGGIVTGYLLLLKEIYLDIRGER